MRVAFATIVLATLLAACAADRPLVERAGQDGWQPLPYRVVSVGGQRGGATIEFVLRLEDASNRRLVVEGSLEINPQPVLVEGRWSEDGGPGARSGILSHAAIDFLGGQGDRPELGGQFTLSSEGAAVYRINLPMTQLSERR